MGAVHQFKRFFILFILLSGLMFFSKHIAAQEQNDPLENVNRIIHSFNNVADKALLAPIARGYIAITPEILRIGINNFFRNLFYPNVILNDFLQGKFKQGFRDSGRFLINTTLGLGGLLDPASDFDFYEHYEDTGQTLGIWGVPEIAYIELPLLGPSSVRDLPNNYTLNALNILTYTVSTPVFVSATVLQLVNTRANLESLMAARDSSALDSYIFTRESYRQRREFLIHDGELPEEDFDVFDETEEFDTDNS